MTEIPVLKSNIESDEGLIIESTATYETSVTAESGDFHVSGLAVLTLEGLDQNSISVRTLLDTGSGTNFICEKLLPYIKHDLIESKNMRISGINSTQVKTSNLVRIFINHENCPVKTVKCFTIPNLLSYNIDKHAFQKFIQNCVGLPDLINPLEVKVDHDEGLGMIIGPGTIRDICHKPPSYYGNYLVDHTFFGPSVSGRLEPSQPISTYMANLYKTMNSFAEPDDYYFQSERDLNEKIELLENLEFLSEKETLGVKSEELHLEDQICISKFKKDVLYDVDNKRYTVALPFNHNIHKLASNERAAFKRVQALQRSFLLDPEYGMMYAQQIQNMQKANFIEEVTSDSVKGEFIHYLPHRGIKKSDSKTTTLRIVMDASCRANESKLSLNDCVYTGPNLIVSMLSLMLKFCKHKFGSTSDIEKAFLQLQIKEAHRDVMRFYFPVNITDPSSKMKIFRYRVVMFGASCSPFLLAAVIQVHLEQHVKDKIIREALENIFFDNLIVSNPSEPELIILYQEARRIFSDMGLNIRQWASNSQELTTMVKKDEVWDDSKKVKVLGYYWDPEKDTISFKTSMSVYQKYTKRNVLKYGNQVMDLLGIILPVEMRFRTFLTKLWDENYSWDQDFGNKPELVEIWDKTVDYIMQALKCSFPRHIESYISVELHIFSDASKEAYGTVAYFVVPQCLRFPEGLSYIRYSKGKVVARKKCPKIQTIPKLELMGMVMSAYAAVNILESYSDITFRRKVLWCDSQTVLGQCQTLVNKSHFVHNRVVDIREKCQGFELRYVESEHNPADLITRQFKLTDFLDKPLWWKGPPGITDSSRWDPKQIYNLHPTDWQEKTKGWSTSVNFIQIEINTMVGVVQADVPGHIVAEEGLTKFVHQQVLWKRSNYKQLINRFTALYQFKAFLKDRSFKISHKRTANDFAAGEREAIRTMQREAFPDELELLRNNEKVVGDKGQYAQLKLYLDTYGIIRLHGRLTEESLAGVNHPILYAYRHPLTISYILYKHKHLNCASVSYTLNIVRREMHSLKLRRQINDLLRKCIICKKLYGRPFKYPEHPPLNEYRTKCSRPFSMVGLDYIGPFKYRTSQENVNKDMDKLYIILFSCLVSRAVYLVLVTNRNTETFLRALHELSVRHTEPKLFISDNEGSFQAANKILQKMSQQSEVIAELREKNIEWKFLASRASWMGGIYERLVQIIKKELYKMQNFTKFNLEEWRSHLHEIEAIVNDRPLSYVSDSGREPEVITPNAILHGGQSETTLATDLNIDEMIASMKQYQTQPEILYREKIALKKKFWEKLKQDYLIALRSSKFKHSNSQSKYSRTIPEVGSVVSIYEPDTKLGGRLGIITELVSSTDDSVRTAMVKVTIPAKVPLNKPYRTEIREKSIKHLFPLELKVDEDIDFLQNPENLHDHEHPDLSVDQEVLNEVPNLPDTLITAENQVNHEDTAPCDHTNCLKPIPVSERGLRWINCMAKKCTAWHHFECAGLSYARSKKFYEGTFYACLECWRPHPKPKNYTETKEAQITGRPVRQCANESRQNWIRLKSDKLIGS